MGFDISAIPTDERVSEAKVGDAGIVRFTWRPAHVTPHVLVNLDTHDPVWIAAALEMVLVGWDVADGDAPIPTTQPAINRVPSQVLQAVASQLLAEINADPQIESTPPPPPAEVTVPPMPDAADIPAPGPPVGETTTPIRMPDGSYVPAEEVNARVAQAGETV